MGMNPKGFLNIGNKNIKKVVKRRPVICTICEKEIKSSIITSVLFDGKFCTDCIKERKSEK